MIGCQKTSVIGVEVKEGEITKLNIGLSLDAIELEVETVIEVKALRNTDAELLKDRQKAAALSKAISADEISRAGSSDGACHWSLRGSHKSNLL